MKFKETKSFIIYSIASAKSKGALLVSATDPMKNKIKIGNKGTRNHIAL